MEELIARLEALKARVWTNKNTGVLELKDAFNQLVDIVHKAMSTARPPATTPRNAAPPAK